LLHLARISQAKAVFFNHFLTRAGLVFRIAEAKYERMTRLCAKSFKMEMAPALRQE
jgi:hypothetical protein